MKNWIPPVLDIFFNLSLLPYGKNTFSEEQSQSKPLSFLLIMSLVLEKNIVSLISNIWL